MLTRSVVQRAVLLIVLTVGVRCAGDVFAAPIIIINAGDDATITAGDDATVTTAPAAKQAAEKLKAAAGAARELAMRPLPAYRIEPPDLLQIEVLNLKPAPGGENAAPKESDQGAAFGDTETEFGIDTTNTSGGAVTFSTSSTYTGETKTGNFSTTTASVQPTVTITSGGTLTKGGSGTLRLGGTSPAGMGNLAGGGRVLIAAVKGPSGGKAQPSQPRVGAVQPVTGIYLVGPDGTVNLRRYGTVQVMGKTLAEAKAALEQQLSKFFETPEVSVDVAGYNSKVYYIVTEGANLGDNVVRVPITGNDKVLDAISQVGGLSQLASKKMWIARPSPSDPDKGTILPIDWEAITRRGATATNYQIFPGDRLFIAEDKLLALNNYIAKVAAPMERVLGLIGLATSTLKNFLPQQGN